MVTDIASQVIDSAESLLSMMPTDQSRTDAASLACVLYFDAMMLLVGPDHAQQFLDDMGMHVDAMRDYKRSVQ
jgi:hypothetical protein